MYLVVLRQGVQELEQFAYIASHDLQELLQTVSSFSTQLRKQYNNKLDCRIVKKKLNFTGVKYGCIPNPVKEALFILQFLKTTTVEKIKLHFAG